MSEAAHPNASPTPANYREAAELHWSELQALDRGRTVCVCAVSALEVHGPHLPIGSDYHQADWMAAETGRRFARAHADWTVLHYPALNLGTDELPLPGSLNTPARVVYRAVRAFGEQLAKARFRYVMLTNGHGGPRHAAGLEAACRKVSRRRSIQMFTPSIRALHRLVSGQAFDEVESYLGRALSEPERHGLANGEHAGTWETSWYLAMHPEWVGPDWKQLAEDHPPAWQPLARAAAWLRAKRGAPAAGGSLSLAELLESLSGSIGWMLNSRNGYGRSDGERVSYSGWPAVASAEIGRAYVELPVRSCLADLEAVTSGRMRAEEVRSIASDPWLIQPDAPRWLAGGAIAALALLWLLL